ncbi:hypothetical protein [Nonomuraea basaltis]|uniref:hypothetical protein n=1 Tax=Nonomuraea basaltis TaxID=2495887 RepID=UPI00110C6666|nr:hypothetical protein [Nonomuraea basaltis]TMR88185.1 hypothetical protein EJK15_67650 [Nonomuraea basaltis]
MTLTKPFRSAFITLAPGRKSAMNSKMKLVVAMGALAVFAVAPSASASASANTSQSACNVQHSKWWTDSDGEYWVRATNECTAVKTFCVDIPYWVDAGPYTILGRETRDYNYGDKGWSRPGVGLYYCS